MRVIFPSGSGVWNLRVGCEDGSDDDEEGVVEVVVVVGEVVVVVGGGDLDGSTAVGTSFKFRPLTERVIAVATEAFNMAMVVPSPTVVRFMAAPVAPPEFLSRK